MGHGFVAGWSGLALLALAAGAVMLPAPATAADPICLDSEVFDDYFVSFWGDVEHKMNIMVEFATVGAADASSVSHLLVMHLAAAVQLLYHQLLPLLCQQSGNPEWDALAATFWNGHEAASRSEDPLRALTYEARDVQDAATTADVAHLSGIPDSADRIGAATLVLAGVLADALNVEKEILMAELQDGLQEAA